MERPSIKNIAYRIIIPPKKLMMNPFTLVFRSLLILLFATLSTKAQDAAAKGLAIAVEAKQRDHGYGDFTANAKMILRNKQGKTTSKEMKVRVLSQAANIEKNVLMIERAEIIRQIDFKTHTIREA